MMSETIISLMNRQILNETELKVYKILLEKFGEPIGKAPSTVGVPDEGLEVSEAGSMASTRVVRPLDELGDLDEELNELEEGRRKKNKGPSKKTAKKILRGTKTFKDKIKKVSGWAEDPAAAAAWMMHKATGKWPSQK